MPIKVRCGIRDRARDDDIQGVAQDWLEIDDGLIRAVLMCTQLKLDVCAVVTYMY